MPSTQSPKPRGDRFWATIEYLVGQRAAIVTLFDATGEWSGGGRVETRLGTRASLYEAGYLAAFRSAAGKGGQLDRFTEVR